MYPTIHQKLISLIYQDHFTLDVSTQDETEIINKWIKTNNLELELMELPIDITQNEMEEIKAVLPNKIKKEELFINNSQFLEKIILIKEFAILKQKINKIKDSYQTHQITNPIDLEEPKHVNQIKNDYNIIYNSILGFSFIIENPSQVEMNIIDNQLFGFKKYKTINIKEENSSTKSILHYLFNNKNYEKEDEMKIQFEIIQSLIAKNEEEEKIKKEKVLVDTFIKDKYKITNSLSNKIQASHLFAEIEDYKKKKGINPDDKTFRNRLSHYLLEMGIKKKRCKEGYFYYGLLLKSKISNNESKLTNNILTILDKPF